MDRREFLGVASAGAGAVAVGGCALPASLGPLALPESDLAARLGRLDAGLQELSSASIFDGEGWTTNARSKSPRVQRYVEESRPLASRALRTLLLTGTVTDMPEESRQHPEVQRRIQTQSDELDQTMVESASLLASLPPEAVADVERTVRSDPGLVMRFHEALDEQAARHGLGPRSRGQLRKVGADISFRLRKQPASLLFGEYVSKFERIAARRGADVTSHRWLATKAAERLIWTPQMAGVGVNSLVADASAGPSSSSSSSSAVGEGLSVGAWTLGIGVAVGGLGALIYAAGGFPGIFLVTVGVVVAIIGLFILLGGGIAAAVS